MLGVPETNQNTYGLTYLNKKTREAQDVAALMIGKNPQPASATASKLIDEHANIPKVDEVKPIHDKDTKFFTDNGKQIDHKTHAGLMNGKVLHTRNNESGEKVTTAEEVPLKISSGGGGRKYPTIGGKKVDIKDMGKRGGARKHIKNASVDELVYTVTYNNLIIKGTDEITAKLQMILLGFGGHKKNEFMTDRRHTIEVGGKMVNNPDFGKPKKNPDWKGDPSIEETRTGKGTDDHSNTAHNGTAFNTAFVANREALTLNPSNVETLSEGDNVKTPKKPKVLEGKPVRTKKPTKIENPKAGDRRFFGTGNSKGYSS